AEGVEAARVRPAAAEGREGEAGDAGLGVARAGADGEAACRVRVVVDGRAGRAGLGEAREGQAGRGGRGLVDLGGVGGGVDGFVADVVLEGVAVLGAEAG